MHYQKYMRGEGHSLEQVHAYQLLELGAVGTKYLCEKKEVIGYQHIGGSFHTGRGVIEKWGHQVLRANYLIILSSINGIIVLGSLGQGIGYWMCFSKRGSLGTMW